MFPAWKLPLPSRLTIAFAVSPGDGATFQARFSVPLLVTGEPLTVRSDVGALNPTLVTLPVPGNVWPAANVIRPLVPSFSPVSRGAELPDPYSRLSAPEGELVLLLSGSASHSNFCAIATFELLLNEDAVKFKACEVLPVVAVAGPADGRFNVPCTFSVPPTSRVAAGLVVLMPIRSEEHT